MITFTHLDWDTKFFKKKIGKVDIENENQTEVIQFVQKKSKKENYNLIYIFCPNDYNIQNNSIFLVDKKVLYTCNNLEASGHISPLVVEYQKNEPTRELINLAIQSAKFSRFHIDKNFQKDDYENLYKIWLINSLNGSLADRVFVFRDALNILGFVSLKITGEYSTIGLIAVDSNYHGRNIGSLLINRVKQDVRSKSISTINVVTQLRNRIACSFYEKNGFTINWVKNIYHYWHIK